jgi:hypothetical protein
MGAVMRLTMRRCLSVAMVAISLSACSHDQDAQRGRSPSSLPHDVVEVEGCFSCCFESNVFVAYDDHANSPMHPSRKKIWHVVSSPKAFMPAWNALAKGKSRGAESFDVSVKIRGTLGPAGSYGHMGVAERELTITHFWGMQPLTRYPACIPAPVVVLQE